MYRVRFGQNKYGAKRADLNGQSFHSQKERDYAFELDLRKRAGDIKDYRRQVKIPLAVNGRHICNYIIDFVVEHKDGSEEYVEVKGFETETWRLKWKLCEALFPERRLTVVR